MKKTVYVDMDNVLVDFQSAFPKLSKDVLEENEDDKALQRKKILDKISTGFLDKISTRLSTEFRDAGLHGEGFPLVAAGGSCFLVEAEFGPLN